jgi:type IV pilus assembly protein PilN
MIRIDLLPKEERRRKAAMAPKARAPRARKPAAGVKLPVGIDTAIVAAILVVAIIAMVIYYTNQNREIAKLEDEIATMQAELQRLQEAVRLVRELEEKERTIKVKLDIIAKLNKDRFLRAHMVDELSNVLPDNCWLSLITEKNRQLTIEGYAFSNFTVADFMRKAETSNYIEDVDLTVLNRDKAAGYDVMKFKLTANLTSYTPPRVPAAADSLTKEKG